MFKLSKQLNRPVFTTLLRNSTQLLSSKSDKLEILPEYTKIKFKHKIDEKELRSRLDHLQYYVTQEKGTERPFFNEYLSEKRPGIFNCIVCDQQLFDSKSKFDSGSGWPSFYDVVSSEQVKLIEDSSYGMKRIEVVCSGCGSHLGHLFNDGPKPTNLRYCINSASLDFQPKIDQNQK